MTNSSFGLHLTLDLGQCNIEKLKDFSLVYDLLIKLPKIMGIEAITLPHVVKWMDKNATIEGISGIVMIADSHISIHTFPEKYFVFADIFSCRNFHQNRPIDEIIRVFESKKYEKNSIKRGLDFH